MTIEQFVETLRVGVHKVRWERSGFEQEAPGTASHLRAMMDYRRAKEALCAVMAERPDFVAEILVRAFDVARVVDDPLGSDTVLGNTLLALGAEGGV